MDVEVEPDRALQVRAAGALLGEGQNLLPAVAVPGTHLEIEQGPGAFGCFFFQSPCKRLPDDLSPRFVIFLDLSDQCFHQKLNFLFFSSSGLKSQHALAAQ